MAMRKIGFWKEVCKFLSGAFFVTAGASWYFAWCNVTVPFLNTAMSPSFLYIAKRGNAFCVLLGVVLHWFFMEKGKWIM
jgi:hypothetical protein